MMYVGPAATRDQLLEYAAPLAQHVASSLTLVTGDGNGSDLLLREAQQRLKALPNGVVTFLVNLSRRHIQAIVAALICDRGKSSAVAVGQCHPGPGQTIAASIHHPSREAISGGISARGYQHRQIIAGESCNLKSIEMAA